VAGARSLGIVLEPEDSRMAGTEPWITAVRARTHLVPAPPRILDGLVWLAVVRLRERQWSARDVPQGDAIDVDSIERPDHPPAPWPIGDDECYVGVVVQIGKDCGEVILIGNERELRHSQRLQRQYPDRAQGTRF